MRKSYSTDLLPAAFARLNRIASHGPKGVDGRSVTNAATRCRTHWLLIDPLAMFLTAGASIPALAAGGAGSPRTIPTAFDVAN